MLKDAFNLILGLHNRQMNLVRIATPDLVLPVRVSPSNYARAGAGPSDIVIEGYEFIIPKDEIKAPFTFIKRGDRLEDTELGSMTIDTIEPMYDVGAVIIGFRLRTS